MEGRRNNEHEVMEKANEERGVFKYVPEDIVRNVLENLPVESLLRFRCVSKQLSCQISNHITKTKVKKVIVHTDQPSVFRSVDQNGRVKDIEIEVDESITTKDPIAFPRIYGSCNEFLLIRAGIYLFLWNPTSGRSHGMLTNRLLLKYPRDRVVPGLCFDSENDDYKVVLGLNHRNWRERSVQVGSFKTKSWSRLDIIDFNIRLFKPGPTLNNCLHWWSSKEIVSFDPKIHKFTKISLPKEHGEDKAQIYGLGVLDGCLCMAGIYFSVYRRKRFGVSEPWEIIFSFPFSYEYLEYLNKGWLRLDHITPLFLTDERKRVLIRVRRTEYQHYECWSCDCGDEGPEKLSDAYVIIAYDAEEDLCKDIVVSSLERIAYDGTAVYEETIVRPVSMRKEVPGGRKKVWKLKECETRVENVEEEKKIITGVDGQWEGRRRMRRGKKSTPRVVSAPVDLVVQTKNAFDLLNDSE